MSLPRLSDFTPARVGLKRAGNSLPTQELLRLQLAHARAREAVNSAIDVKSLRASIPGESLLVRSLARNRTAYLQRPDLGRRLDAESRRMIEQRKARYDAVFVIADGLSALAVELHAAPLVEAVRASLPDWSLAPIVIVEQGRVAIGDEIGDTIGADLAVVLIGERPGLSAADSLGVYMTWRPKPGRTDAERNCISNIRREGLSYAAAAFTLAFLMNEARSRQLSGVNLKDDQPLSLG